MKQLLITYNEGTAYKGHLPEGWHEVPVQIFVTCEGVIKNLNTGQRLVRTAALLSGIPVDVLREDVSLAARIQAECPFFFNTLPEPEQVVYHRTSRPHLPLPRPAGAHQCRPVRSLARIY